MRKGLTASHHEFIDKPDTHTDAEAEVKELEARRAALEDDLHEIAIEDAARLKADELRRQVEALEAELDEKNRTRKE